MKAYAYIADGIVIEVIQPSIYEAPPEEFKGEIDPVAWEEMTARIGKEVPIAERVTPEFLANLVCIADISPAPEPGMFFVDGQFLPPPGLTPEELFLANKATRDSLLGLAQVAIAPLVYADELNMATPEEKSRLESWKLYSVQVNRVDLSLQTPEWPASPD